MKTLNLKSAILFLLILTSSVFAMAKVSEPVQDTKQIITEKISYPEFAIEKQIEGTVEVIFIIDSDGKIVIENITSKSEELQDYVKTKIENIQLADNLNDPTLKYSLKLNFNLK